MSVLLFTLAMVIFFPAFSSNDTIRQLDEHVAYLHSLYLNHRLIEKDMDCFHERYVYKASYGYFKHPQILSCIEIVENTGMLDSFFDLWLEMKKSSSFEEAFLEEFTLINIIFFNNILDELTVGRAHPDKEITVDEIIQIYNRLAALPLAQLISLLNGIVECVAKVVQTTSVGYKLFSWLRSPWWDPFIMVSTFIINWFTAKAYRGGSPSYISMVY